ncbi:M15 family metallopeptidase [Streptomyces rubiginosohelvolus]|uniref:M15 family metallopeptidase n=1 Tax=Streptomyces rubiginosohelvolus TaxID=67362 RepID=UPI00379A7BCD
MMPTPTSPLTGTESGLAAGAPGATLALRREVLIPQAYVRRSDPGVQPPRWDLLVAAEGRELDMGTAMKATPEDSDAPCFAGATNITAEAKANRAVLTTALTDAGLQPNPFEWWHFSLADRYGALMQGQPTALYGPTTWPRN